MPAERRVLLDGAETVAACAEEMSECLAPSESTEIRAFVRSFVKAIPPPLDKPHRGRGRRPTRIGGVKVVVGDGNLEGDGPRRRERPLRPLGDGGRVRRWPRRSGVT